MPDIRPLVEQARKSELFTAPILEADTARFLAEHGERIREMARRDRRAGVSHVYFVGSGGSYANMHTGAYLMRRFTTVPADAMLSYQLVWEAPRALGPGAVAFFASYSGATEDTLAALRFARSKGARTIAIVKSADSPMGREADDVIAHGSIDLYGMPLATAYLYALEHARADGWAPATDVLAALNDLPPLLGAAYRSAEAPAEALAHRLLPSQVMYCLGSGVNYGLAYKFALTVFMENIRVHGSFIESSEFRHGPAEMLERQRPDMFFLLGDDETRAMSERSMTVARDRGATVIPIDVRDYPGVHPLLSPFVLLVPLQWFVVYSAILRGITDLDERVLMGRRILSEGGAVWP
jgi:fructoselysine 6-phosphate deglycase